MFLIWCGDMSALFDVKLDDLAVFQLKRIQSVLITYEDA